MDEGVRKARRLDGLLDGPLRVEEDARARPRGRRIEAEVGGDESLHARLFCHFDEPRLIADLHAPNGGDHDIHGAAGAAEAAFVGEVSFVDGHGRVLERLHRRTRRVAGGSERGRPHFAAGRLSPAPGRAGPSPPRCDRAIIRAADVPCQANTFSSGTKTYEKKRSSAEAVHRGLGVIEPQVC